jgi:NADPH:quinone reductase-like Zn-dependent oxidoreductase
LRAAIINTFGPTSVLELVDMPKPSVQADEVLVRVHAAAANPKDTFIRKGRLKRFTGNRFPMQMGFDYAGEVTNVGAQVKGIQEGEHVYGMLDGWHGGTCAEYVVVKTNQCASKPESLTFEQAAALPMVTLTALQAIRDEASMQARQTICINGASGGVGSMAVQIAKIYRASVTAISSVQNHDFLHKLGADNCIDYHVTDISQTGQEFDIFFDVFGNQRFQVIKPILSSNGVWVSTVLQPHVFISIARTRFLSRKKAKQVRVKSNHNDLTVISGWADAKQLKPIINGVYPLDKICDAHAQQETKHTRGKIIVQIQ